MLWFVYKRRWSGVKLCMILAAQYEGDPLLVTMAHGDSSGQCQNIYSQYHCSYIHTWAHQEWHWLWFMRVDQNV